MIFSSEITLGMDEFEEEFSKLLLRHASLDANDNNIISETSKKLSTGEIIGIIQKVIRITFKINLQNLEDAALKTPANEIVITTPNAPDVLRLDYNQNNTHQTRYKFLEGLGKENDDNYLKSCNLSSLSNYSDEVTDISDNKSSITEPDTIHQKKNLKNDITLQNKAKQSQNRSCAQRGKAMHTKFKQDLPKPMNLTMYLVEEAYTNAVKVVKKLDELKELLLSEIKPTRRLSTILRLPIIANHLQQSQQKKQTEASIQHSKALRRYVQQTGSDSPVTPTSSKSNAQSQKMQTPKKTSIPRLVDKRAFDQYNRILAESGKTSTTRSPPTRSPPTKNPSRNHKYAHIQSTIPKLQPIASVLKRKSEKEA